MELTTIHKRVIGLDVHQAQITACAIIESEDGAFDTQQRQFGTFKRDRRALAEWAAALRPDLVSWKAPGSIGRVPTQRSKQRACA